MILSTFLFFFPSGSYSSLSPYVPVLVQWRNHVLRLILKKWHDEGQKERFDFQRQQGQTSYFLASCQRASATWQRRVECRWACQNKDGTQHTVDNHSGTNETSQGHDTVVSDVMIQTFKNTVASESPLYVRTPHHSGHIKFSASDFHLLS